MDRDIDWNLLAKYLFDECTEEEKVKVRTWIEEDPKRIAVLRQLRRTLQSKEDPHSSRDWDTDALWTRIERETQPEEEETNSSSDSPSQSKMAADDNSRRVRKRRRAGRLRNGRFSSEGGRAVWAGAVLLVAAIVALGLFWQPSSWQNASDIASDREAETFTTQKGERAMIRLTDGTHVQLNVDSRLTVPADFGEETREIELEGEAFFEVTTDSTRPFLVQSREAVTRVLGTAFDVSAYPDEEGTRVVVAEGRVALSSEHSSAPEDEKNPSAGQDDEDDVVLAKDQMARIAPSGNRVVRRGSDPAQHLAWMEGQLVLERASFEEVTRKLERWYDLDVSLPEGTAPPPGHLNARFSEDQPLPEVLSVVATAFGLEYERRRKRVTFSSTGEAHLK